MLELVQGGVERALLNEQHIARQLPNALCNRPAVHRLERERLENQEIEGALDEVDWLHWL